MDLFVNNWQLFFFNVTSSISEDVWLIQQESTWNNLKFKTEKKSLDKR